MNNRNGIARLRIEIHGAVQGVGFRPFVYRLAEALKLKGWVLNSSAGVFIEVEGDRAALDDFYSRLETDKPPRAYVHGMESSFLDAIGFRRFEIRESDPKGTRSAFVVPDIATCPECAAEIFDPANRRFLYPFTNCTNCGPRFSIIKSLPYDRPNTTMADFDMCDQCRAEYENPGDRRFHAQPNACPKCGPHVELWERTGTLVESLHGAILKGAELIRAGKIIALKGVGGFQLLADARNDEAVRNLRARKHREEKPFALMFPSLELVRRHCEVSRLEEKLLLSPEAPIVLLKRRTLPRSRAACKPVDGTGLQGMTGLAESVAPRNPYLGIMLPYSPLHLILMREIGFPVVATSGNISDEPICTDEHEAVEKLGKIADLFLVHNRPIERQVDDSVVRVMAGRTQLVRRARGYAPFPIGTDLTADPAVLAVGGHLKNTIAMNSGNNVFVSQHIGDLSTDGAYHAFDKAAADFRKLYDLKPAVIVHDLHPDYSSTRSALKMPGEKLAVQHHFAHVAACMAENRIEGPVLGVSWDGTGFGDDGNVWGGEFLLTDGISYERRAAFRTFRLPGSNASVKEPRRTAIGLLYEIFGESVFDMENINPVRAFDSKTLTILKRMLERGFNSPFTTSAGRLFDAVSAIVGISSVVNFEGQGAMELEFAADDVETEVIYEFEIVRNRNGTMPDIIVDWEPTVRAIVAEVASGLDAGQVAAKFHNTLTEIIVEVSKRIGEESVALTGGCFQNKYLTERTVARLTDEGFRPYWHQRVPTNDGGISLGQMFVALKRMSRCRERKSGIVEERNNGNLKQAVKRNR